MQEALSRLRLRPQIQVRGRRSLASWSSQTLATRPTSISLSSTTRPEERRASTNKSRFKVLPTSRSLQSTPLTLLPRSTLHLSSSGLRLRRVRLHLQGFPHRQQCFLPPARSTCRTPAPL